MKKTLAIVLTGVFVLGLSAVAFADTTKKILEPITSAVANAVSSDSTAAQNDNNQKVHDNLTSTMNVSKLEVYEGDKVTVTATTEKHGQFQTENWDVTPKNVDTFLTKLSDTVLDKSNGNYIATAQFYSNMPGTYKVTYDITMDAGVNDGKFISHGFIEIKVLPKQTAPSKVVSFIIKEANVHNQDNGNAKDALYITALEVTYGDDTTDIVRDLNIKIGNIFSKDVRKFDVTYEGVTKQFSTLDIPNFPTQGEDTYTGKKVTTTTPEKSKQPEKAQTPVKPEKPEKPEKPAK